MSFQVMASANLKEVEGIGSYNFWSGCSRMWLPRSTIQHCIPNPVWVGIHILFILLMDDFWCRGVEDFLGVLVGDVSNCCLVGFMGTSWILASTSIWTCCSLTSTVNQFSFFNEYDKSGELLERVQEEPCCWLATKEMGKPTVSVEMVPLSGGYGWKALAHAVAQ